MPDHWKMTLLGLAVAVPMGAFVVGSLVASAADEPPRRDTIVVGEAATPAPVAASVPTPSQASSSPAAPAEVPAEVPVASTSGSASSAGPATSRPTARPSARPTSRPTSRPTASRTPDDHGGRVDDDVDDVRPQAEQVHGDDDRGGDRGHGGGVDGDDSSHGGRDDSSGHGSGRD